MTKILLVEDDKSLREIYGVRLQAEGYEITSAGNGEEALALAIKERPNLIISDVMMPKISGFDMLDILRSTTETKDIRVIMMTALGSEDQRQRGEALGADRYLVKSQVGIEDVVRTVHDVLGDLPGANLPANQQPHPIGQTTTPADSASPIPPPQVAAPAPTPPTPMPTLPDTPVQQIQPQPTAPSTPALQPQTPAPAATVPMPPPASMSIATPQMDTSTPQSPPPAAALPQAPLPTPVVPAPQPQAQAGPAPTPATEPPSLPEPVAPFSSPRPGNLGDRVIQPLTDAQLGPPKDLNDKMSLELSGTPVPTSMSSAEQPQSTPAMPTPQAEQLPQPATPSATIPDPLPTQSPAQPMPPLNPEGAPQVDTPPQV